jgi:hypothetical protein
MSIFVDMEGESGSSNGPKSDLQTKRIKAALKKEFPDATITFNKGHYYCSAFVRFSPDRVVYMSTSDYRHFPQQFIVRTAKDEKDYTGGYNNPGEGFDRLAACIAYVREYGF